MGQQHVTNVLGVKRVGELLQVHCFLANQSQTQSLVYVAAPIWKRLDLIISRELYLTL